MICLDFLMWVIMLVYTFIMCYQRKCQRKNRNKKRFHIVKREFFCAIIFVIVFVMSGTSEAWFAEDSDDRPFFGRAVLNSGLPSGELALYDDISAESVRILMFPNRFFISVDTINIDIPLTLLESTPVSSMEALDRLMVANLRVRLLINEYKDFEKRAENLLKNVYIPHVDALWLPSRTAGKPSLSDGRNMLDNKVDGILLHAPTLSSKEHDRVDYFSIDLQEKSLLSIIRKDSMEKSQIPLMVHDTKDLDSVENSEVALREGRKSVISFSKDNTLPWIVGFFMRAVSYCLSHKIEVFFCGAVLLSLGYFISLKARDEA